MAWNATAALPGWTLLPFPALLLAMAVLPAVAPRLWERRAVHGLVVLVCALPVVVFLVAHRMARELGEAASSYAAFVAMLGSLFVAAGGIDLDADFEATPASNALFLFAGGVLASLVGTTAASVLLIRPFLATNRGRPDAAHLLPFFVVVVANAGGLLTPLGNPPLLIGYLAGVPFMWTLRLWPAWVLYVATACAGVYAVDRRAFASARTRAGEGRRASSGRPTRLEFSGKRSVPFVVAIGAAALLSSPWREIVMILAATASYLVTPPAVRRRTGFTFAPLADVAVLFAGLFACLPPIEALLFARAASLPIQSASSIFWASGLLSSVLDNAPTYSAFLSLTRGLSVGLPALVAGVTPLKLAALSLGTTVMGATTYIGNGPNLVIKAIAERESFPAPSFLRFAGWSFCIMLPAHLVVTAVLAWAEK
ncbi:MAG TPA: sodium:proton antiporter [Polyangiaceae bacterium]|nr:sodium:proton antiporter [Polyangiaceae bacterium]